MLTTKDAPKRVQTASSPALPESRLRDLEFISENQQLEGFPGKITEEIATYQPDLKKIIASAKRFGAQIPTEENAQRKPLFKR